MGRMRRPEMQMCPLDMTPMIDVVFQLIIFFIVTMKMDESKADIELEIAKNGPVQEHHEGVMEIEVDQRGWITIKGVPLKPERLRKILRERYRKHGEFPVTVRGDWRTKHRDIRSVMDICSGAGLWRINFLAIKEQKSGKRAFDK